MPDKSRAPRKQEPEAPARRPEHSDRNVPTRPSAATALERVAELEELLVRTRQELEKNEKISRSLARNCQRAEQALRRSEDCFELVSRFSSDLVFRLGKEGKFRFLSPSCLLLLGYEPTSLLGRNFFDVVEKSDHEKVHAYFQAIAQEGAGAVSEVDCRFLHASGGHVAAQVRAQAVLHLQTHATELIGMARPSNLHPLVSPRELEGDILGTTREALAVSLAHELNQPLTALTIMAGACGRLVRADPWDRQELVQAIDQVAAQADRAGEMVRRMRQLITGGSLRRSTVQINDLVHEALHFLQDDLEKEKIRPQLQLAVELPSVFVDRVQIGQVIVNLVRNAVEAMVETPQAERVLTLTTSTTPTEVVLAVSDTGAGLAPLIAERLFSPYQTTKPHGMGLGLALSRSILQAHSGRLWVEPPPRRGTTFCFALPLANHGNQS